MLTHQSTRPQPARPPARAIPPVDVVPADRKCRRELTDGSAAARLLPPIRNATATRRRLALDTLAPNQRKASERKRKSPHRPTTLPTIAAPSDRGRYAGESSPTSRRDAILSAAPPGPALLRHTGAGSFLTRLPPFGPHPHPTLAVAQPHAPLTTCPFRVAPAIIRSRPARPHLPPAGAAPKRAKSHRDDLRAAMNAGQVLDRPDPSPRSHQSAQERRRHSPFCDCPCSWHDDRARSSRPRCSLRCPRER